MSSEARDARSRFREALEELLGELGALDHDEPREVVTTWVTIVETAQLDGGRKCRLVSGDSTDIGNSPIWEMTGLLGWASQSVELQYMELAEDRARPDDEED